MSMDIKITPRAMTVSKLEGKGKLLAQPNHTNVNVISLRSGKVLNSSNDDTHLTKSDPPPFIDQLIVRNDEKVDTIPRSLQPKVNNVSLNTIPHYLSKPSFPSWLAPKKKDPSKD